MNDQTENVAEEIQNEEVVQSSEADASNAVTDSQSPAQSQEDKAADKEYNFNQLRKSKEQLEQRVEELETYFKSLQEKSSSKEDSPEDFGIGDEDLAEGKHLKRVYSELRSLQKQIQQEKIASIPERLKTKFQDFDSVVSQDNIKRLQKEEPELYSSIIAGTDLYAKGVAAYKAVKALGYANPELDSQKKQVQTNHERPMSAHAVRGQGALSEQNIFARGLTPELKKQLQAEMAESVKAR